MSSTRPSTKSATRDRTTSDGFTLLELLVAISIFSLIVGMATFSLRYAFGVFRHLDAPFAEETRRVADLRDAIASSVIYVGERSDMFNQKKQFYTWFNGDSGRMTFISGKPLALPGPALCRLVLKDGNLVLEESPLMGKGSDYQNPAFDEKELRRTVIFSNVKSCAIEYFQGDKKVSELKEDLPTLVKVDIATDSGEQQFFCRVQSDFTNKKLLLLEQHDLL